MKYYMKNVYTSVIINEIDDYKATGAKVYVQF
jgi:hypothetical protein